MQYLSTSYTLLGYESTIDGKEIAKGGNHPMCSESRILPSDGPWDDRHIQPLKITEIKRIATYMHIQCLLDYPNAIDSGCHKDKDGQDEELAMLDIMQGMSSVFKREFKRERKLKS
jgi:hypothetical protein